MPFFVDAMFRTLKSFYLNKCLGAAGNGTKNAGSKQLSYYLETDFYYLPIRNIIFLDIGQIFLHVN
jgi:hypothetical protein